MTMVDDIKKGGLTTLAIGAGILALVPAALPLLAQGVRPMLKGAIKGGLVCLEKGQEAVAEVRAVLESTAAEARADVQSGRAAKTGAEEPVPAAPAAPAEPIMAAGGEPSPEVMG